MTGSLGIRAYGFLSATSAWAWLVPLILVGAAVGFIIAYYRSPTFRNALGDAFESVGDAAPSKTAVLKTVIRPVSTDEYNQIMAQIAALFTSKRFVPQSQGSGFYVYQKQEAPRGCLMIFVHVIVALLLFALCLIPGIIYLVVIFSRGDKINNASVQITPVNEGYSFDIKAPGGIKRKIYQILEPYAVAVPIAGGVMQVAQTQTAVSTRVAPALDVAQMAPPLPGPTAQAPQPVQLAPSAPGAPAPQVASQTTAGPSPDEKECPYCAEIIKAKAVKCKHCGSDLA